MIIILLSILTMLLIAHGTYRVAERVLSLPRSEMREVIRDLPGRRSFSQRLEERILTPIAKLISKLVPIGEYKQRRIQSDLDRLERNESPEEYLSLALSRSLLLAGSGFIFIPLGIPWLTLLTAVAGVLAYFRTTQELHTKVAKVNRSIGGELPRLVESLNYSIKDRRDLVTFFEKYRRVAGRAMGRELDKLILDMKIGNHELALRNFDARLAIPQLSALVSILCGVYQGVDQRTSLLILEQDIRTTERELTRREMEKRPGRIKAASFILTILMILMFMVPLVLLIIKNLKSVGF